MRTLLILVPMLFSFSFIVGAETINSSNVENIELNLKDHEMAVTFISLSDGEATLIQGPDGRTILVDIGGKDTEKELNRWLKLYKVKNIDSLILTKADEKLSYPQLNSLIAKYGVKEIITYPGGYADVLGQIDEQYEVKVYPWEQGQREELLPELIAEAQLAGTQQNEGLNFTLEFFNNRLFFLSSFNNRAEETLLKKDIGNVTVLKISCRDSTPLSGEFLAFLNPEISILPAAEDVTDSEMISNLHDTWSEIYSTKRHGTVTLKFSETKYEVFTIPVKKEEN
ncbi:ComEC/Rec2 family competence protein [Neobacillus dielmonensis]|uniref:hypothetical protein n=1 Tax=Neobacillus dielmonensis TaxID=1347369 RepID=UPI0005A6B392|nr:hypothetical protein [Neobacillus dielmonensis]